MIGGALEVLDDRGGMDLEAEAVSSLGGDVTARSKELVRTCGSSEGIGGALLKKIFDLTLTI